MGLFVHVQYSGDWWGEDPLTETVHETPGALYRALSGQDKSRPWEALGRCTGRMYIDVAGSPCELCGKARDEHEHNPDTNRISTRVIEPCAEYPNGAVGAAPDPNGPLALQHYYQAQRRQIGWVFVARNPEPTARGDEQPTGLREAWVSVHTAPDTVTRTPHYAELGTVRHA